MSFTYGARTQFPIVSNLNSLNTGQAKPLGLVNNASLNAQAFQLDLQFYLSSSGNPNSTVIAYLIQGSVSGVASFTDQIDYTSANDVSNVLTNAIPIKTMASNANNSIIRSVFDLPVLNPSQYWSIVVYNNTGQTISSGNAHYIPIIY